MNLQSEKKSIEVINKYRSITKYDRVVSVSNDGNENMIIVSRIQKNDRLRNEVLLIVVRGQILLGMVVLTS